jgi:3-hydroxyisobutyrate dehydrogenase-like beta-hydroxyacid dehydrogenase
MARKKSPVGILGLGIIGSRAAAALRAEGYPVFVWNRTPLPAPNFLGSPADVARTCKVLQLFVADASAVLEVIDAMAPALTPEHCVLCSATIGPDATREAAAKVEETGARFLDAPFTGSKAAAENRQLVYYVGGEESVFQGVKTVLQATSKAIVRMGNVGDAALVKVATNMISAVSIQALSEALALVEKSGIPPQFLASALEFNGCRSGVMELKLPKMLEADYEPHFSLKHMLKDVQFGLALAKNVDLELPACATTRTAMADAVGAGHGDADFAVIHQRHSVAAAVQPSPGDTPI